MPVNQLTLTVLDEQFAINRLRPTARIPQQLFSEGFYALVKSDEELSIICRETLCVEGAEVSRGWRGIKVLGPLDFSLTGIISGISNVLSQSGISLFAISSFETDYFLVRSDQLFSAITALRLAGYRIRST